MDYKIHEKKMCDGAYGTQLYIGFSGCGEVEIKNETLYFDLQTGHFYDHEDYNYPTNSISIYTDNDTIRAIDQSCADYNEFLADAENNSDIIKLSETEYFEALESIENQMGDAEIIVNEILGDEEEKIENDNNFYVCVIYKDEHDQVCSYEEIKKFDDEDEATEYRDRQRDSGNSAYFVDAETAYNHKL